MLSNCPSVKILKSDKVDHLFLSKEKICAQHQILKSSSPNKMLQATSVIPFPNKPWFLRVCSTSLWKTLWEKEKLLVTSNFSFFHNVFYWRTFCHFHQVWNCRLQTLSVWKSLKFVVWKGLFRAIRLKDQMQKEWDSNLQWSDWKTLRPEKGALIQLLLLHTSLTPPPFPNNPWFLRICSTSLLKTL